MMRYILVLKDAPNLGTFFNSAARFVHLFSRPWFPLLTAMPDETTTLLQSGPTLQTSRGSYRAVFVPELLAAFSCMILKVLSYSFKYFILFHNLGCVSLVVMLVLSEAIDRAVSFFWCEVSLSFEAAVFARANVILNNPGHSDKLKELAFKANRKSISIPDACQRSLELAIDQGLASFMAFSKAGCGWPLACGASTAMLSLVFILQLGSKKLVSQVSASRRQKENNM